jgi:hypothetical protein
MRDAFVAQRILNCRLLNRYFTRSFAEKMNMDDCGLLCCPLYSRGVSTIAAQIKLHIIFFQSYLLLGELFHTFLHPLLGADEVTGSHGRSSLLLCD